MKPENDPELRNLLHEWQSPAISPSLEDRVLAHRSWWRFFLQGSVRVPVPLIAVLALALIFAGWRFSIRTDGLTPCLAQVASPIPVGTCTHDRSC